MTLEELWQLFPIILTESKCWWKDWYEEERRLLEGLLEGVGFVQINHIGSTAIPEIWEKPIIDVLIEVENEKKLDEATQRLQQCGYICMSRSAARTSLNKGYTEDGFAERVFHIHLHLTGDCNEILFRDYLIAHPDEAKAYEALKQSLWKQYEHNRDRYTQEKAEFVNQIMQCIGNG